MSDGEWDADDFEPGNTAKPVLPSDKWEGEDEDDDVKDAWDKSDSEEDKSKESISEETKAPKKGKKKLADKIAEREALLEQKHAQSAPLTEEEKLEEKLRVQKLEERANLQLTRDMCGIKTGSIDNLVPESKEDFELLGKAIVEKIQLFSTSQHYNDLIEDVANKICVDLNTASLKKVKLHIEGLHSAKLKEEKAAKSKQKGKGKSVKMDLVKDIYGGGGEDYDDGMDDFM